MKRSGGQERRLKEAAKDRDVALGLWQAGRQLGASCNGKTVFASGRPRWRRRAVACVEAGSNVAKGAGNPPNPGGPSQEKKTPAQVAERQGNGVKKGGVELEEERHPRCEEVKYSESASPKHQQFEATNRHTPQSTKNIKG